MKILDRYIISQILNPVFFTMGIGILLALSERLVRILKFTLNQEDSFYVVFEMMAYLVPHYLGTTIPIALFIGFMLAFNNLNKNSEIDAMMASGAGLWRIVRPALYISFVVMLIGVFLFGYFQPLTRYAYRMVLRTVQYTNAYYLAEDGVFMKVGNKTIMLDGISHDNKTFDNVFIFDDINAKNSQDGDFQHKTTTATRGSFIMDKEAKLPPFIRMYDGRQVDIAGNNNYIPIIRPLSEDGTPIKNTNNDEKVRTSDFERIDMILNIVEPKGLRPRGIDERELTLLELYDRMDDPPSGATKLEVKAELVDRIIRIAMIPFLPLLAIAYVVGARRSQRSYRFVIAIIVLIASHKVLQHGKRLVMMGNIDIYVGLWLPAILFMLFSAYSFYRSAFFVDTGKTNQLLDMLGNMIRYLGGYIKYTLLRKL